MPVWQELKKMNIIIRFFKGVNASVIGLLIAAFYCPYTEGFENKIAPLKTHITSAYFNKYVFFVQIKEFEILECFFSKTILRF